MGPMRDVREWTFRADVFTVWLAYEFSSRGERTTARLVDANCDCDAWERIQGRPVRERTCPHLYAARVALECEFASVGSGGRGGVSAPRVVERVELVDGAKPVEELSSVVRGQV